MSFNVTVTWSSRNSQTIYAKLKARLGREPSNQELEDEVKRILDAGLVELASAGKLPHQRKRK